MMETSLDAFIEAVRRIPSDTRAGASTSVRRRPAVSEALELAVGLGLGASANGVSEAALVEHLQRAARDAAVAEHYARYPEDRPSRAEVALVALRRAEDPLLDHPDLVSMLDRAEALLANAGGGDVTAAEVIAATRGLAATPLSV